MQPPEPTDAAGEVFFRLVRGRWVIVAGCESGTSSQEAGLLLVQNVTVAEAQTVSLKPSRSIEVALQDDGAPLGPVDALSAIRTDLIPTSMMPQIAEAGYLLSNDKNLNEAMASTLSFYALEELHGPPYAQISYEWEDKDSFIHVSAVSRNKVDPRDGVRFIVQWYLPRRYGKQVHTRFSENWGEACRFLRPNGYSEEEAFAVKYSVACEDNLSWLFNLTDWGLDESHIQEGMNRLAHLAS